MNSKAKFVYIAHPIGGDVKNNFDSVKAIVREISMNEFGVVPFAPYLVDLMVLNDEIQAERELGMWHNDQFLRSGIISEVRLYGPRISRGMMAEVKTAWELGVPVLAKTPGTKRDLLSLQITSNA